MGKRPAFFRHRDVGNRLGLPAPHSQAQGGQHRDAGPMPVYVVGACVPADTGLDTLAPLGPGHMRRRVARPVLADFLYLYVACTAVAAASPSGVVTVCARHGLN